MNYSDIIVYDFETSSANPQRTQPVQLAAVVIHGRKLEIKPGSEFQSLIKPIFDPVECEKLGLDPLQEGAVKVHGKTQEILEKAPSIESVWPNFVEYTKKHNFKGNSWGLPIICGWNIRGFDNIITQRICGQAPYNLGPLDKNGKQGIFNPIYCLDMMDISWALFEDNKEINSLSMDRLLREYMGMSQAGAHDAMKDVTDVAKYTIRTLKWLRTKVKTAKFKGCFGEKSI